MFSCPVTSNSATPWTAACQAVLAMGFPRQEYWSELPFPTLGSLPEPRIKPMSPALAGGFFTTEPPGKPLRLSLCVCVLVAQSSLTLCDPHGL